MRILIVEDHPDSAGTLRMVLSALGHQTRLVMDGETALLLAPKFQPEAVILDLGLPGMQGHETARRLRQLEGAEKTLIVVLSGWDREDDRKRSREVGVDHHLVKPLDLPSLTRLLDAHAA